MKARRRGIGLEFSEVIGYALGEPARNAVTDDSTTKLTKREHEVADLVAEGLTNKEIATRLVISPRTAQGHVEHVLTKLAFTSRSQIAAWVAERRGHSTP